MLVVAEVEEPYVPLPDDLLVNLRESRHLVEALLDSLPRAFSRGGGPEAALGPALQAAFLVMNHIGGKLLLFAAAPPSLGIGRVKAQRDNPALYGTDREASLRSPDDPFYKRYAAEASRFQICVDVWAAGAAYMDLPSLGALPKYTGGALHYYPSFAADRDGRKLAAEVCRNLTRETAWEGVMRIRCSKGLRIAAFFGHFFIRSSDLLALPACDADKTFSVEIAHEETVLAGGTAYVQAALLYTSSGGERRIRVHTSALPVVSDLAELYRSADPGACAALLGKAAVERSYGAKLEEVRASVTGRLAGALREYRLLHGQRGGGGGGGANALVLPERLKALPLLTLGEWLMFCFWEGGWGDEWSLGAGEGGGFLSFTPALGSLPVACCARSPPPGAPANTPSLPGAASVQACSRRQRCAARGATLTATSARRWGRRSSPHPPSTSCASPTPPATRCTIQRGPGARAPAPAPCRCRPRCRQALSTSTRRGRTS